MERKFWRYVEDYLDYCDAYDEMDKDREKTFVTRQEWNGVHYINRWGEYCILLSSGEILVNPIEIWSKDKPDWVIVEITDEARRIIENHSKGELIYDRY